MHDGSKIDAAVAARTAYPSELEHEVVLKDGTRARIRPIRADDAPGLIALYGRLSHHTAYQRFFTVMRRLPPDWARYLADVDYHRRLALVAERDEAGKPELIGVARYEGMATPEAPEVAVVVQDGWQGKGVGTILLHDLLRAGEARGFHEFRAYVLADNARMLHILGRYAKILKEDREGPVKVIRFERRPA